jgi:hypothetical protein
MRARFRQTLISPAFLGSCLALTLGATIGLCSLSGVAAEPLQPVPEVGTLPANGVTYTSGECYGPECSGPQCYGPGCHLWPHHLGLVGHDYYSPLSHALFYEGKMYSPDYGWGIPMKYPMDRMAVQYLRYWPQTWYGMPRPPGPAPRFPMVYQPTDTTQLGYYYQRVPMWLPNHAMIPPPPSPAQWHRREDYATHYQHFPANWAYPSCRVGQYSTGYGYGAYSSVPYGISQQVTPQQAQAARQAAEKARAAEADKKRPLKANL